MTDGTFEFNANFRERVGFYYDLVKANVQRIVVGLTFELRQHPVVALAVTPGWLRSENMLDNFGVTEETWRDALAERPGFAISESPAYVGRGVAAARRRRQPEQVRRPLAHVVRSGERVRRHRYRRLPAELLGHSMKPRRDAADCLIEAAPAPPAK